MPIKLARALGRKLRHQPPYWSRHEVRGLPLVFAIQDFHTNFAMRFITLAATEYVFGVRHERVNGVLSIEGIDTHRWDGQEEPSGFFSFDGAENVSAVLVNPQGTITKFNRMGYLAGFETEGIEMFRSGVARGEHNIEDPRPVRFRQEVHAPGYTESWVEGAVLLHNPRALVPLDRALFPGAAHEFLQEDGSIMSFLPEFHPIISSTRITVRN